MYTQQPVNSRGEAITHESFVSLLTTSDDLSTCILWIGCKLSVEEGLHPPGILQSGYTQRHVAGELKLAQSVKCLEC